MPNQSEASPRPMYTRSAGEYQLPNQHEMWQTIGVELMRLHLTRIRRKFRLTRMAIYVSAMHWKELTTSSGPFSAKKLS